MRLRGAPPLDLTYCLNVHPGETWEDNFDAIRTHALAVRRAVAPGRPFGLGMRLGAEAARTLAQPACLAAFKTFLAENDLTTRTINGFPYGTFHQARVKEQVYAPDWRDPARAGYTCALVDILAALLPRGVTGSISTVPGAYRASARNEDDLRAIAEHLADVAAHAEAAQRAHGADIVIALEPEPDCLIETTRQLIDGINGPLAAWGAARLRDAHGVRPEGEARALLKRRIGACLDTAHAAVAFEEPAQALRALCAAGVRVGKIQVSAALELTPDAAALACLAEFADSVYLHQVRSRSPAGEITAYPDLPQALAAGPGGALDLWRVHFHVPVFLDTYGPLRSTAGLLNDDFARAVLEDGVDLLEIETYTFGVLPEALRARPVAESISEEYRWVLARFQTDSSRPER